MDKKQLSERDICTKFITPALRQAGWDELTQLREEVSFTKGRVIVRGQMVKRGKAKRADHVPTTSRTFHSALRIRSAPSFTSRATAQKRSSTY